MSARTSSLDSPTKQLLILPTAGCKYHIISLLDMSTRRCEWWLTSFAADRNYVDQQTALAQNLTFATDTSFIMRADSFNTLNPAGPGRNSVRVRSNNAYTTHVSVYVGYSCRPHRSQLIDCMR